MKRMRRLEVLKNLSGEVKAMKLVKGHEDKSYEEWLREKRRLRGDLSHSPQLPERRL